MGLGLPAPEFWTVTLAEAAVIMRSSAERETRRKRIEDGRAYTLAQLISYSVNDPRRMPRFDKVFPDGRPRAAQSPAEIWQAMTDWAQSVQAMEAAQDG